MKTINFFNYSANSGFVQVDSQDFLQKLEDKQYPIFAPPFHNP